MWSSHSASLPGVLMEQSPNAVHGNPRTLSGRRGKCVEHSRSALRGKAGVRGDAPLKPVPGGERGQPVATNQPKAKPSVRPQQASHDRSRGRSSRSGGGSGGGGGPCVLGAVRGEPERCHIAGPTAQLGAARHPGDDVSFDAPHERRVWNLAHVEPHHVCFDPPGHRVPAAYAAHLAPPDYGIPCAPQPLSRQQPEPAAALRDLSNDGPHSHSAPLHGATSDPLAPFDVCARPTRSQMEPRAVADTFVSDREWPFAAHDALDSTATLSEDSLSPHASWSHSMTFQVRSCAVDIPTCACGSGCHHDRNHKLQML